MTVAYEIGIVETLKPGYSVHISTRMVLEISESSESFESSESLR